MNYCDCKDGAGKSKNLYYDCTEAQEQIDYARRERKVKLKMYKCPEGKGWHLTSQIDYVDFSRGF